MRLILLSTLRDLFCDRGQRFHFLSPYSPDECHERLRPVVDGSFFSALFGIHPLVGAISASHVKLRQRVYERYLFQRVLTARLSPAKGGTRIEGIVQAHTVPLLPYFWMFFFGVMLALATYGAVRALREDPWAWESALPPLIPLTMLTAGPVMMCYEYHRSRGQAAYLISLVKEQLDAEGAANPGRHIG